MQGQCQMQFQLFKILSEFGGNCKNMLLKFLGYIPFINGYFFFFIFIYETFQTSKWVSIYQNDRWNLAVTHVIFHLTIRACWHPVCGAVFWAKTVLALLAPRPWGCLFCQSCSARARKSAQ